MDQDDPEKRIAELERRLAEAHAASDPRAIAPSVGRPASTTGGFLTPEQVHNVAFSRPPRGKRGYNEDQVDAFLELVEAALRDPTRRVLTPEQVHNMAFSKPPIGKRGYNEDEVDAFLDVVEQQIGRRAGDAPSVAYPGQGGPPDLDAVAGVGPRMERHTTEHSPGDHAPPDASYPATWAMKIRPNPFLFWTPRWRDWGTSHGSGNTSSGSNSGNILFDLIFGVVFAVVFDFLFDIVWAAIAYLVEVCLAVVLAPIALLTSVLGVPRHRLLAVSEDGGEERLLKRGSWYAVRRARAEARA